MVVKRSKVVALVAVGIGHVALAGCDRRPDCRPGDPPGQDCKAASGGYGHATGGGYAHAWWPFSGSSSSTTSGGTSEASVTRGGFGGTGEAMSGGGHGGGEGGGGGHGGGGGE